MTNVEYEFRIYMNGETQGEAISYARACSFARGLSQDFPSDRITIRCIFDGRLMRALIDGKVTPLKESDDVE